MQQSPSRPVVHLVDPEHDVHVVACYVCGNVQTLTPCAATHECRCAPEDRHPPFNQ
jgi:hypothetical protein